MITTHKLYLALRSANVSEEHAADAAQEMAELLQVREDIATIKSEVSGLKWMFGGAWAILVILIGAVMQILLRIAK